MGPQIDRSSRPADRQINKFTIHTIYSSKLTTTITALTPIKTYGASKKSIGQTDRQTDRQTNGYTYHVKQQSVSFNCTAAPERSHDDNHSPYSDQNIWGLRLIDRRHLQVFVQVHFGPYSDSQNHDTSNLKIDENLVKINEKIVEI